MTDNSFTHLEDVPIVVCNDCGASAFTEDRVQHYDTCKAGDAERWKKYYDEQVEETRT